MAIDIVRRLVNGIWKTEAATAGGGATPDLAAVLAVGDDAAGAGIDNLGDTVAVGQILSTIDPANPIVASGGTDGLIEVRGVPDQVSANISSILDADDSEGENPAGIIVTRAGDFIGSGTLFSVDNVGDTMHRGTEFIIDTPTTVQFIFYRAFKIAQSADVATIGFFGSPGVTQPNVPLTTPSVQDVIDALVAVGLVEQSD